MHQEERMVSLETLGNGAAVELFQREIQKVIENILDLNTSDKAKRSVTLKVEIAPAADRGMGSVSIQCKSTLAPVKDFCTRLFFGQDRDGVKAVEHDPRQPSLPFSGKEPATISPLREVKK